MVQRFKRSHTIHNAPEVLASLARCRATMNEVCINVTAFGPAYVAALKVMDAIDAMAENITGDKTHFHLAVAPSKTANTAQQAATGAIGSAHSEPKKT